MTYNDILYIWNISSRAESGFFLTGGENNSYKKGGSPEETVIIIKTECFAPPLPTLTG